MPKKLFDQLSDAALRGTKPGPLDYKVNDGRGLVLVVKSSGARLWRLRYVFAGKERMLALGEYPDVGLKVARERASAARDLVRQGVDPVQQKREDRAQHSRRATPHAVHRAPPGLAGPPPVWRMRAISAQLA